MQGNKNIELYSPKQGIVYTEEQSFRKLMTYKGVKMYVLCDLKGDPLVVRYR